MDTQKLSHWVSILSNVGLLTGLVLVAIQINQNTNLARIDMVSRNYESSMMFGLAMMGEDPAAAWSKAALDPDSLTDHDLTRIQFMVDFWWNYHDRLDYLEENGLAQENWTDALDYHASQTYGGNRAAAAVWEYWLRSPNPGDRNADWKEIVKSRFPEHTDGNAELLKRVRDIMKEQTRQ